MASVTSLDSDMKNLRLSRYTPQVASEVRQWIETTLSFSLPPGDLLDALKDGVALCKLVNLVNSPGIKYKQSNMPFVQMENISNFLRACEIPPLSMPSHDRFLTVDLYENKDSAQVLQCLVAFSRQANKIRPDVVMAAIGGKKTGTMSPANTGGASATNGIAPSWRSSTMARSPSPTKPSAAMPGNSSASARAMSPSLTGGSTGSQQSASGTTVKSPTGPVSSWSKRTDEGTTAPAWNIHQYGYMGGASQGNQGISFGARRQITSQAPAVPSLFEKERMRKQKIEEDEAQRKVVEEERRRRLEDQERQAQEEEQRRWEDETNQARNVERTKMEEQKRQWADQERRWKEEDEVRRKEDQLLQQQQKKLPPEKPRVSSSGILRGQTLSEWQREQAAPYKHIDEAAETPEQKRFRELEKQLEEARERERQYQTEREERSQRSSRPSTAQKSEGSRPQSVQESETSFPADERDFLRQQWQSNQDSKPAKAGVQEHEQQQGPPPTKWKSSTPFSTRPLPSQPAENEDSQPSLPQRVQQSTSVSSIPELNVGSALSSSPLGSANRPLPTPDKEFQPYMPVQPEANRTDRFLSTNTAPQQSAPRVSSAQEASGTSLEQFRDRDTRVASQQRTKAGGWASKSLLEREMERERERQREWEAAQQTTKDAPKDQTQGTGEGQTWDVNQYGFVGGDGMNRGSSAGSGINFGGRRQILGPREMKR